MILLSIETSCDETALSLIQFEGEKENLRFTVLGNQLISQAKIHEQYGGVFPVIAKREHGHNLAPLFFKVLDEAMKKDLKFKVQKRETSLSPEKSAEIISALSRENELSKIFLESILPLSNPGIDNIAVTHGPGLEPALWVGVSFAKALSLLWDIPIVPVNHMEGHIYSALLKEEPRLSNFQFSITNPSFPALALLISGGHTELVLMKEWGVYEIVGKTRDDAVGEAFDKAARILGLPYPGGPQISKLAEECRIAHSESGTKERKITLPRPMIHSKDLDFSFSGLKTAVLYMVKEMGELTPEIKAEIAREFEDAVTEVLISKTEKAIQEYGVQTLILGGGVIANRHIREAFAGLGEKLQIGVHVPAKDLTTDNALMIAIAGAETLHKQASGEIRAEGNLKL